MARIRIADLNESSELDRRAMQEIRGGARGSRQPAVRYRAGFQRAHALLTRGKGTAGER